MLDVKETTSGYSVSRSCEVCNDNFIFIGNSTNKDRAINVVNNLFNETHLECSFNSAIENSAVNRDETTP